MALVFVALAALAACAGDDGATETPLPFAPAGPEAAPDPAAPGPFPVGVRTLDLFDPSRPDEDTGAPRFLRTEVWYPATAAARDGTPWTYHLAAEIDEHVDAGDHEEALLAADVPGFPSTAGRDAELDRRHGPYPVVLLSHGAFSLRFHYVFLSVHLASHGYVVVAPDHRGNTIWDGLRTDFDEIQAIASGFVRPYDLIYLVDHLTELDEEAGSFLEGALALDRIAAVGHSMGGSTAVTAPCLDARFDAAVLLAPIVAIAPSFGFEYEAYPVPLLMIGGPDDRTIPWRQQYCDFRAVDRADKLLVSIERAGHFTFSDLCALDWRTRETVPTPAAVDPLTDGCSLTDNLPVAVAHRIIRHYTVAFLNQRLRDSPGSGALLGADSFDGVTVLGADLPDWPEDGCP